MLPYTSWFYTEVGDKGVDYIAIAQLVNPPAGGLRKDFNSQLGKFLLKK